MRRKTVELEVAQDEVKLCPRCVPLHLHEVDEALAPIGCLRRAGVLGKEADELRRQDEGVHHPTLRPSRVNGHPLDRDVRLVGREALTGHLAEPFSIERVGNVGGELLQAEVLDAGPGLLVGRETQTQLPVRSAAIGEQELGQGHEDRDPGLVVRAEQGRPVRRNDGVAGARREARRGRPVENLGRIARKDDRLAVDPAVHNRLHAGGAVVRRCVHVGEEGDRRRLRRAGRRDGREDKPRIGQADVLRSKPLELLDEEACQVQLFLSRGDRVRRGVALRVNPRVPDESFLELGLHIHAPSSFCPIGRMALTEPSRAGTFRATVPFTPPASLGCLTMPSGG